MGTATTIYGDYLPVGDISVLALCFLIFILFLGTFVHRNTQYRQLRYSIWCILAGTVANLVYHQMLKEPAASVSPLKSIEALYACATSIESPPQNLRPKSSASCRNLVREGL